MQLDELKKNMSTLEQILAMTNSDITIDVSASENAQTKILKKYRQMFTATAVLAIVFTLSWIGNMNPPTFPVHIRAFLVIYLGIASLWYVYMYFRIKKINVSRLTPAKLFSETTSIKIYALSGEVVSGIALAVFFTLFLSNLNTISSLAFYLCITTLVLALILSLCYFWPKYFKLFRDLNAIKE